jgi:hypothetical protein
MNRKVLIKVSISLLMVLSLSGCTGKRLSKKYSGLNNSIQFQAPTRYYPFGFKEWNDPNYQGLLAIINNQVIFDGPPDAKNKPWMDTRIGPTEIPMEEIIKVTVPNKEVMGKKLIILQAKKKKYFFINDYADIFKAYVDRNLEPPTVN